MIRCKWSEESELLQDYHDNEWGEPVNDDQKLFECLILELFQSGLSWRTILHKRDNFRKAFSHFQIESVKNYSEADVERLLLDAGIVRHRKKIEAAIKNASVVSEIAAQYGSFYQYLAQLPDNVEEKKKILQKAFHHFGMTTAESFLEATGFIPASHDLSCHKSLKNPS
ncbi:DNA-3-methyladenine glycosylase I [Fictibacillus aquaticus]|uniref:DNA-3-methyladenine glycosylase n=1 Tax=Fictibacillus aquaticus TaxID=2021314 RepID=A0A235F4X9_9BACL|nr:DNA-3-methyladenine glycosylase I [Fictibacillus aquaticus]OYD56292.1 DNA-3-methyladenine glycosylase [Fictibacillus aquaticus]